MGIPSSQPLSGEKSETKKTSLDDEFDLDLLGKRVHPMRVISQAKDRGAADSTRHVAAQLVGALYFPYRGNLDENRRLAQ